MHPRYSLIAYEGDAWVNVGKPRKDRERKTSLRFSSGIWHGMIALLQGMKQGLALEIIKVVDV